jgi:hypothetical protein
MHGNVNGFLRACFPLFDLPRFVGARPVVADMSEGNHQPPSNGALAPHQGKQDLRRAVFEKREDGNACKKRHEPADNVAVAAASVFPAFECPRGAAPVTKIIHCPVSVVAMDCPNTYRTSRGGGTLIFMPDVSRR